MKGLMDMLNDASISKIHLRFVEANSVRMD